MRQINQPKKPTGKAKRIPYYIIGMACLLASILVYANNGKLFQSDKLSSSLINCVAQDRYGFIWVGTDFGLSRFDGYHFTNYRHDKEDTTSILDNIITRFHVDKQGRLWIGSAKGLMRYDYHTNTFVRYPFPDKRSPRVYSIIENRKGDVLIGSAGYGLYSVRKGTDHVTREKEYCPRDSNLFYTHIFEDTRGDLWQSSHLPEFYRFHRQNGKMRVFSYQSPKGAPIAFFQHRSNVLLVVCRHGILYYEFLTGKLVDAGYDFGDCEGVTINTATFDHLGNLYLGTSERGVLWAPEGSKTIMPYVNQNEQRFNLANSWINDIMEDKDNNLWLACYKKGLYLINNQEQAFASWNFSGQGYAIGSAVSSLVSDEGGYAWCTVQNSGVFQFDPEGNIVSHPASPAGTSYMYKDKKGDYWIGTSSGLYSYQPESGTYQLRVNFAGEGGFYCMAEDNDGKLYISVYSKGLYIYDTRTGDVKVLNSSMRSAKGSLCNDWIRALMFDRDGLLWIGTSNGLACLDTKTYSFHTFGWNYILPQKQVNYLCEDNEGNIVIGTSEGLYRFQVKENKPELFPKAEKLEGMPICGIVKDKQGDIWVSTTKGIWCYDNDNAQFIGHVSGNGIRSTECVVGAVARWSDDKIAIGTADGITVFYPSQVKNQSVEMGKVYLTNFIVDGKSIDFMRDEFSVPYSQNSFSLEFSMLNYKNDKDITFQYRINGSDWLSMGDGDNTLSFTKLAPGYYAIEVRATNNGVYSETTTTIPIRVLAPWYATTWAYLLYIVIIGTLAVVSIWNYERHRRMDLEEQKMRFLINATHDIRSPLTLIIGPLEKLKARLTDSESKQDLSTIDRNAHRLLLLVNQILDERKIDKNQMRLHCEETDLVVFIHDIMSLFSFQAQERNIQMRLWVDGVDSSTQPKTREIKAWIDHTHFDKVIANLLGNAMKYTFTNGSIDIYVTSDKREVEIKIIDTGEGFKDERTDRLFDRFYQGKVGDIFQQEGTGIGLNLSRSIVRLHGGKIKAYNRLDGKRGACLQINLPLGKAHLKPEEIMVREEIEQVDEKKSQGNRNLKVLLVDDDFEIVRYIKNELSTWYKFDYAPNGKEAMKKLLEKKFDVIVSDIVMPEMDGLSLLKQVKKNPNICDIPIILLTSKNEVESRLEGLRKGADAYLSKPFNMRELHVLIDNLADNVRRLRGKFTGAQKQEGKLENVELKGYNDQLMERIMKCLNENLGNPDFNVEQLIKEVGISRAHLHRKMKEITGLSTGEFIRNLRMEQAARLILEGSVSVTQVAYAVGFSNQTHFSTVFKKHFGVPPSEYAEKHREDS